MQHRLLRHESSDRSTPTHRDALSRFSTASLPMLRLPSLASLLLTPSEQTLLDRDHEHLLRPDRLRLAADYILDARQGLTGELRASHRQPWRRSLGHLLRSRLWSLLIALSILSNASLILFEPASTSSPSASSPSFLLIFEFIFCLFLSLDHILHYIWLGTSRFLEKKSHIPYACLLFLLWLDLIISSCSSYSLRWSRPLRFFLFILRWSFLRRTAGTILRITPRLLHFVTMMLCFFSIYSVIGVALFRHLYQTCPYSELQNFDAFPNALLAMTILFTTENFPDIFLPGLAARPVLSVLFFVSFIVIAVWLCMSLLLAVVYEYYREEHKKNVSDSRSKEYHTLVLAFEIVKETSEDVISRSTFEDLMKMLRPSASLGELEVLYSLLDVDGQEGIALREFLQLPEVMDYSLQCIDIVREEEEQRRKFGNISQRAKRIVDSVWFKRIALGNVLMNALATCWFLDAISIREVRFGLVICWICLVLMIIEQGLQYAALGKDSYVLHWKFDCLIIGSAVIIEIIALFTSLFQTWLLVLRAVRIARIISLIEAMHSFRLTFYRCFRTLLEMVILVMSVFYFYSVIGMELFSASHLKIAPREDPESFDSFFPAVLSIFQISTTNNWQDVTYPALLDTSLAYAPYFVSCFFVINIVILNLVAALVIDVYTLVIEHGDLIPSVQVQIQDDVSRTTQRWLVERKRSWSRAVVSNDLPALNDTEVVLLRSKIESLKQQLLALTNNNHV